MALSDANMQKVYAVLNRMDMDQLQALNSMVVAEMRHQHKRERAIKLAQNLGRIKEGTKVRLSDNMKPRYLSMQVGRVTRLEGDVAVIALQHGPMGKFRTGTVRVKIDILTVIEELKAVN